MLPPFLIDISFVITLVLVGGWLESINGKHGLIDELLTPFWLGAGGILVIILEGKMA